MREFLQPWQRQRAVETSRGRGWRDIQAKSQCARAIVGRLQQVCKLAQDGNTGVLLDDAPTPVVRTGIAQHAEQASHAQRFERALLELQLQWIERHGIVAFQVPMTINEAAA